MDIHRADSRPTRKAPSSYFTGDVWQDVIVETPPPATLVALRVRFAPGARTHWHTHPLGQTLLVVSGIGRIQKAGEPLRTIRPGDTVFIPPDVRHWHGAAPDSFMEHIAMQERVGDVRVTWLEPVSDADYLTPPQD